MAATGSTPGDAPPQMIEIEAVGAIAVLLGTEGGNGRIIKIILAFFVPFIGLLFALNCFFISKKNIS